MLVIINSLPKSGSTWFHGFVQRCLEARGHPAPHRAVQGFPPAPLNSHANPGVLDGANLDGLLAAAQNQTFAIKAHQPPNQALLKALDDGAASVIFLIRHPAAIVRSALAFGELCRAHPEPEPGNPYEALFDPDEAADFVAPSLRWAREWLASGRGDIVARYEEMFSSRDLLLRAANRLHPDIGRVSDAVARQMEPRKLTDGERKLYRVNMSRRPALSDAVLARCEEWAHELGYVGTLDAPT